VANKIDTLLDAIETGLNTLVEADGGGVLKAVQRGIVDPLTAMKLPVAAILPSEAVRSGGTDWNVDVLLMVCTRCKGDEADATISEIMGEIETVIDGVAASDAPGGAIDMPRWDFWYRPGQHNVPVGAWATLRLQVTGPIKIPE